MSTMTDKPAPLSQAGGFTQLRSHRKPRKALPPRHPGAADQSPVSGSPPPAPNPADASPVSPPRDELPEADSSSSAASQPATPKGVEVDPSTPDAHIVAPTVLSIPDSIVNRFTKVRTESASNTAVILDALRAHVTELPDLILARRPGARPGDLFPWRETPGATGSETPAPIRIRPTKAELTVMKGLIDKCNTHISQTNPGAKGTNRSEMIAAALDAYLPGRVRKD